jgi:uncharacterized protein (TIGR03437 family)
MLSPKTVKILKFSCVLAVIPALIYAHEYGPDPGYTAAPGDNPTACVASGCHVGTVNDPANGGSVAIMLPGAATYTPGGAAQLITVLITDANRQSWGFQMTARLASNLKTGQAGGFTDLNGNTQGNNSSPVQVICATGNYAPCPTSNPVQWVEHTLAGWSASVAHKGSYSFQTYWTPPATNVGNVTLYVAGNASNSANTSAPNQTTGHIYTANVTLTPAAAGTAPSISSGGVVSALSYGGFASAAPGSWIEIYGNNLASNSRTWAGSDFTGSAAPTTLDGVKVTVGGQSAYIAYISAGQVNAQVPSNLSAGPQPVVVTTGSGASSPYSLTINSLQPGLLAPSSFMVGGKQYVAAFHSDQTFVMPPGAVAGVTSSYAKPGEIITLYGVGFGPVSPSSIPYAGQLVPSTPANTLANPFAMSFGGMPGVVAFSGLVAQQVGLYQFNVTIPQISNSDLVPVTFTLAGTPGSQTLYTAVHN